MQFILSEFGNVNVAKCDLLSSNTFFSDEIYFGLVIQNSFMVLLPQFYYISFKYNYFTVQPLRGYRLFVGHGVLLFSRYS